jgi:hypothetical protein
MYCAAGIQGKSVVPDRPAGAGDAPHLAERSIGVLDEAQDELREDSVECRVGPRQLLAWRGSDICTRDATSSTRCHDWTPAKCANSGASRRE